VLSAALLRGNGVIHRGINRFKEMTTATSREGDKHTDGIGPVPVNLPISNKI
jgi:hypothetical protein